MSGSIQESRLRGDDQSSRRSGDSFSCSVCGLECAVGGHNQSDNSDLQRLAICPRSGLQPIANTTQDAIGNVKIGKTVCKELLNGKWFNYAFVPHDFSPQPKVAAGYQNTTRATRNTIRFRAASCAIQGQFGPILIPSKTASSQSNAANSTSAHFPLLMIGGVYRSGGHSGLRFYSLPSSSENHSKFRARKAVRAAAQAIVGLPANSRSRAVQS